MPIVHVFRGKLGGQFQRVVGEGDVVMFLVVRLQALQDLDRFIDGWFADFDFLEAAGQGAVAFER